IPESEQVDRQSEPTERSDAASAANGDDPALDDGRGAATGPDRAPFAGASPFSTSADASPARPVGSEPGSGYWPDSTASGEAESPRFSNVEDPDGGTEDTVGTDTIRTE